MNPILNFLKNANIPIVSIISSFIFFVVAAKLSTPAFFGQVAIIQLFSTAVSLLELVNTSIVSREIAYQLAKNELDKKFISTAIITSFLISPLFLALLAFSNYLRFLIPYLILFLLYHYLTAILIGLNKFTENMISWSIFFVIRWGVSVIAVIFNSILLFIAIWTLAALICDIYSLLVVIKSISGLPFAFDKTLFKRLVKESYALNLKSIASFFSTQGDRLIVVSLLGTYFLAIYQFAALLADVPGMILRAVNDSVLVSSSYFKAKGADELRMSRLTFKAVAILTFVTAIVFLALVRFLVPTFFPAYKASLDALSILSLSFIFSIPFLVLTQFIISYKRDLRLFTLISLIDAVLVVLTSIALVPRLGILGAAISQLIVAVVNNVLNLLYSLHVKVFKVGKKELLLMIMMPVIFVYELFFDKAYFSVLLLFVLFVLFKLTKIFNKHEKDVITYFIEKKLSFTKRFFEVIF
ncbi:polysaccharide biosynthesis-related protein [Sulfolobus virus STSV2]|uniref:polysaccharide biosynthesis-related protein n=1 Tax=Sulfolobus virus STSV2 TaxID=1123964 RepID=UPI0002A82646|nr:polysaccharide biosynthesis-related protein [Sulfolobus virus STSV2]AFU92005.1 polysaccharide biosynthesis-related protein [Sulfolobus virus STSV2]